MLRGISELISPELMTVLMEMGHGDEIILADANFPSVSHAKRLVRAYGLPIPPLLAAILELFPLDGYVAKPVALMELEPQDTSVPAIWAEYQGLLEAHQVEASEIDYMRRQQFYRRARRAFAIVATGETAQYGNILLKKGTVDAPAPGVPEKVHGLADYLG